ncbi:hypothetical protein NGRA_2897 [Nosema granulosis]|uniref:Reverse transcriptase n=1 Tax=Nosema granulosis TaxID=83296 RepID=A0A9P6GYG2_9MICR|nr:hypothetical protein NGRA_2897 [Nosema granulosis]
MRRHNEVVKCLHLLMAKKYGFTRNTKVRTHSVQEVMTNDNTEILVDTRVATDVKVSHNKPDILIVDKKRKKIIIIEVGITNLDLLSVVENEKLRKYDFLANELGLIHKCRTKIIPYVMTWDGVMTNFHKKYLKELDVQPHLEAYIQSLVLKKTLESISLDRRRGYDMDDAKEKELDEAVTSLVDLSQRALPTAISLQDN